MTLVVLLIGVVLIVSALRGTYETLFSDLGQDVPKFVTWAAAIVALGAIGFVPGLRPVSRGLMSLVLVVLILQNYQAVLAGLNNVAKPPTVKSGTASSTSQNSVSFGPPVAGSAFAGY